MLFARAVHARQLDSPPPPRFAQTHRLPGRTRRGPRYAAPPPPPLGRTPPRRQRRPPPRPKRWWVLRTPRRRPRQPRPPVPPLLRSETPLGAGKRGAPSRPLPQGAALPRTTPLASSACRAQTLLRVWGPAPAKCAGVVAPPFRVSAARLLDPRPLGALLKFNTLFWPRRGGGEWPSLQSPLLALATKSISAVASRAHPADPRRNAASCAPPVETITPNAAIQSKPPCSSSAFGKPPECGGGWGRGAEESELKEFYG